LDTITLHHDAAEAFYVLEASTSCTEDREFACPAGSFIFIPKGVRHGFRVGDFPSRNSTCIPAAMIGYFDQLAAAVGRDDLDDDGLDEIALACNGDWFGPPYRALRVARVICGRANRRGTTA